MDLTHECVRCSEDCDALVDRDLDGSWVVHYPELNVGEYGEMVWTVTGDTVSAYYLSGLLPGQDNTVVVGNVTKDPTKSNTSRSASGAPRPPPWQNSPQLRPRAKGLQALARGARFRSGSAEGRRSLGRASGPRARGTRFGAGRGSADRLD